ncbi:MAG: hypothetical protein PHV68_06925 [Candidatus Gastranaerophilales bacterium]|nr:hypothetical protein [Candidatus Gastranaerophilales bacterium]
MEENENHLNSNIFRIRSTRANFKEKMVYYYLLNDFHNNKNQKCKLRIKDIFKLTELKMNDLNYCNKKFLLQKCFTNLVKYNLINSWDYENKSEKPTEQEFLDSYVTFDLKDFENSN